jgi:hypothetical protein
MKLFCALFLCAGLWGADGPRLFYSKSFPGSVPAFVSVTLDKSGNGEYREAVDEEPPLKFRMSAAEAAEIFGLVEKLDYFKRPLEAPVKVAFMGTKTFRLENGPEKGEVKFNYSEDPDARLLADWFERISESQQHLINLERSAKYDRLGVLKALLMLESAMDRNRVVAMQQYLPLLDRIAKNESYLHSARQRAANLADGIRAAAP